MTLSSVRTSANFPQALLAEYRQTLGLRLFTAVFAVPFGTAFVQVNGLDEISIFWLTLGSSLLLLTLLVWINGFLFRIFLYTDGIEKKNIFGRRFVSIKEDTRFFYRNTREYVYGIQAGTRVHITVDDGANKIKLNNNVKNIHSLQDELMNMELSQLYPAMRNAYKNGKKLDFGVLTLQFGMLVYKNRSLPLSNIDKMTLNAGIFKVRAKDKMLSFCSIPVYRIANMASFFQLIEEVTENYSYSPKPAATSAGREPSMNNVNNTSQGAAKGILTKQPLAGSQPSDGVISTEPICPKCEKNMQKRRASNGPHSGKLFWVCTAFPDCKSVIPVTKQ